MPRKLPPLPAFILPALFLFFFFLSFPENLEAQIVRQVTLEAAANPRPDDLDYLVPLPCGLTMAFRPVFIPEKGYLGEVSGYFGSDQGAIGENEGGENFINRKHKIYLGSALTVENLPEAYRPKAQAELAKFAPDGGVRTLFLMGKYEVSNAQYRAVMTGDCALTQDSARPAVSVSFYDALKFSAKLMELLLAENPESLPRDAGDKRNIGFLRLPTEEEWEYAARGGHTVPDPDALSELDFFVMEEGKNLKDYALYDDQSSPAAKNAANIGSYLPNPLGIHDTAGNAAELIYGTFKMTLGSRLHGSAGGPVAKGGSFRGLYRDVNSGARQEFAFFFADGPAKSADLGFRLVISSVNMGSFQRLGILENEYQSALTEGSGGAPPDPVKIVDGLIAGAASPGEKKSYENLRSALVTYGEAVREQDVLSARNYVWSLLYNIMGIRTNSLRIATVKSVVTKLDADIKQAEKAIKDPRTTPETVKAESAALPKMKEDIQTNRDELSALDVNYQLQRARYNSLLLQSREFQPALIQEQLAFVKGAFTGKDVFTDELKKCFETVVLNLNFVLNINGNPEDIKREDLELKPSDKK
ncbi:MAG: formylglycine-generating enzyme family protein [Deltaproteobacteria bacterium]|jgi:hypothetical protein|nr:formylglycine-generating enzyme family protein [Deltaproteobacteria bacterium]